MRIKLSILSLLCLLLAFGMTSCEGDEGPAGIAGDTGPIGPTGPEGPEGNGFQDCVACHQTQAIAAKMLQYDNSVHATGGHYSYNWTSCAVCHTSQGFLERVETGSPMTAAPVEDPLPQNCYTCHEIHRTFTADDWVLTQTGPVTLWEGGETVDLGQSNLCISCHQPRVVSPPLPDPATGGSINITNKRYGPHHGPQGVMLSGLVGYEVAGSESYSNSVHTFLLANNTANGCISCHMATAQGSSAGGHTFRVTSEGGSLNDAGCSTTSCHPAGTAGDLMDDRQMQIDTLLNDLRTVLVDKGLLDANTDYAIVPQDFDAHEAGALYNFKYVLEDKSRGVHNFKYAKALLINSKEAIE